MKEDLRLDSHKLIYHPEMVSRWLNGENIYPIEMRFRQAGPVIIDVFFVR